MTLEQWLAIATRNLAPSSADRVRSEIEGHIGEAQAHQADPVAELGDPAAANREYASVLLTSAEAAIAPTLQNPTRSATSALKGLAILSVLALFFGRGQYIPWPLLITIWSIAPLAWFFPPTTRERNRIHIYAYILRNIAITALATWNQGWIAGLYFGVVLTVMNTLLFRQRTAIFRKLAGGQIPHPFPGEPRLTHNQAVFLNTMRNGEPYRALSLSVLAVLLAVFSWWLPATFAPLGVSMALIFAFRWLPIATPGRSRWYRLGKWSLQILASALPVYWAAPAPWTTAAFYAYLFWLLDSKRIVLRRKLPVADWPRDLYF